MNHETLVQRGYNILAYIKVCFDCLAPMYLCNLCYQ